MRSIWKGAISFGLVNIPVKLYSATQQSNLDLDMLDKRDMGKIRFRRVNENTGKEVPQEAIGKAFNLDGRYVMLEDEDYESAAPEKSKIIEVNHFINEKEVDTIFFENSYYVEPEKSGEKAYALLREALAKSGKVGIAQFVLRSTEALTVLKPKGNILVLSKIRFAEEIRSTEEFNLPDKSQVKPNELKMALTLIDQYTGPFNIEDYRDEYAHALMERIQAKAAGKAGKVRKIKIPQTQKEDLMEQLKASLARKRAS
jgi:DNA end-binding protein Ku